MLDFENLFHQLPIAETPEEGEQGGGGCGGVHEASVVLDEHVQPAAGLDHRPAAGAAQEGAEAAEAEEEVRRARNLALISS